MYILRTILRKYSLSVKSNMSKLKGYNILIYFLLRLELRLRISNVLITYKYLLVMNGLGQLLMDVTRVGQNVAKEHYEYPILWWLGDIL